MKPFCAFTAALWGQLEDKGLRDSSVLCKNLHKARYSLCYPEREAQKPWKILSCICFVLPWKELHVRVFAELTSDHAIFKFQSKITPTDRAGTFFILLKHLKWLFCLETMHVLQGAKQRLWPSCNFGLELTHEKEESCSPGRRDLSLAVDLFT